jgi:hypothetical protein
MNQESTTVTKFHRILDLHLPCHYQNSKRSHHWMRNNIQGLHNLILILANLGCHVLVNYSTMEWWYLLGYIKEDLQKSWRRPNLYQERTLGEWNTYRTHDLLACTIVPQPLYYCMPNVAGLHFKKLQKEWRYVTIHFYLSRCLNFMPSLLFLWAKSLQYKMGKGLRKPQSPCGQCGDKKRHLPIAWFTFSQSSGQWGLITIPTMPSQNQFWNNIYIPT